MTDVLITVDTALQWEAQARGASWRENLALSFGAVPGQLELLAARGLKACYFVDPMPALVHGIEPVRRMVEPILAAGQEVQLLLHPVWQSVAEGVAEGARFELVCYDAEDQLDLIETGRDLLVEAGAPAPIAFRAGSYAADVGTLAALVEAGFDFDSSRDRGRPSALPLEADLPGPADLGGLVEVPVDPIGAGTGDALVQAAQAGRRLAAIAATSLSPAEGELDRLFARIAAERLPTVHFADLDPPARHAGEGQVRPRWPRPAIPAGPVWSPELRRRSG
jgi:hypothetical protein